MNPELWYPPTQHGRPLYAEEIEASKEALAICDSCPEKLACLRFAMENNERVGIWGGVLSSSRNSAHDNGYGPEETLAFERERRAALV